MEPHSSNQVLQRLQEGLEALQLNGGLDNGGFDLQSALPATKGAGPRLFCGHVPKEVTEDLVKAHFSRWGVVTDVYFPRHKKTLKRRPFCFVTFNARDCAERALNESPLNICGIPIKNLTMVEDRDKYYQEKQVHAQQALLAALQTLGGTANVSQDQINNLAAMLVMEGVGAEAILSAAQHQQHQQVVQQQVSGMLGYSSLGALPHSAPAGLSGRMSGYGYNDGLNGLHPLPNSLDSRISSDSAVSNAAALAAFGVTAGSFAPNSPIPQALPPHMGGHMGGMSQMSRDSSVCSISSADWFSSASSRRTSIDANAWGGAPPNLPQPGRLSLDAGLHAHMQHRMMGGYPGGPPPQFSAAHRMGSGPLVNGVNNALQSSFYGGSGSAPSMPPGPDAVRGSGGAAGISAASALQSAFFSSSPAPSPVPSPGSIPGVSLNGLNGMGNVTMNGGMGPQQPSSGVVGPHAVGNFPQSGSFPLPPIREGIAARHSQDKIQLAESWQAATASAALNGTLSPTAETPFGSLALSPPGSQRNSGNGILPAATLPGGIRDLLSGTLGGGPSSEDSSDNNSRNSDTIFNRDALLVKPSEAGLRLSANGVVGTPLSTNTSSTTIQLNGLPTEIDTSAVAAWNGTDDAAQVLRTQSI